jgi:hypothetical protein
MVCLNALTRHLQPQVIQARERAQIRVIKDSIGHVEVFQMDGVGTPPIIEGPGQILGVVATPFTMLTTHQNAPEAYPSLTSYAADH